MERYDDDKISVTKLVNCDLRNVTNLCDLRGEGECV